MLPATAIRFSFTMVLQSPGAFLAEFGAFKESAHVSGILATLELLEDIVNISFGVHGPIPWCKFRNGPALYFSSIPKKIKNVFSRREDHNPRQHPFDGPGRNEFLTTRTEIHPCHSA